MSFNLVSKYLPSCSSGNSLPEGLNVLDELSLTSSGGDKDDGLIHRKVVGVKEGELTMSNRSSGGGRTGILVYEVSCSGMNKRSDVDGDSCGRGPKESLTEGEDVDESSRRTCMDSTAIASDVPSVTLPTEG